jgi:hypothetical protein
MNFIAILGITIILVAFAIAGLAIRILVKKGGRFPNTHVSGNKYLKSKGVSCAQSYDRIEQAKSRQEVNLKNLKIG